MSSAKVRAWFKQRTAELTGRNFSAKETRRLLLAAVRRGLQRHPLDLRGSRRALEAAQIFLELDSDKKEGVDFLDTSVTIGKADKMLEDGGEAGTGLPAFVCPTMPCQWLATAVLRVASLAVSHPNTIPLLFVFLSFVIWLYDCITDMVVIETLWSFQLPIMYPSTGDSSEVTYLSYQTLTIDLYAPLLLLVLLFSLMFTLLSCSCSRLSDQYRLATAHARPQSEHRTREEDATTILARYDFHLSQAVTASLPQFVLQFSAYMLVLYMLETLKGLSGDKINQADIQARIDGFSFSSLWFSGLGSSLSLCVAQYTAFKIQHEHDLTLQQRIVYFLACVFNTIAMMTTSIVFVLLVLLPCSAYIGRYHLMILVLLGAALLAVATLVSLTLAAFSLDCTGISADRIVTRLNTDSLLTAFLRFSQTSPGQWSSLLGGVTIIGKVLSLITVNLFLPPSQLLIHPFTRFYATSPRSPALHYAIAKQLTIYNLLYIISSVLLCIDINSFGFNYSLSPATARLLVASNLCGVPAVFLSLLTLFLFYSRLDPWTSQGVHMVYIQDQSTVVSPRTGEDPDCSSWDETRRTVLEATVEEGEGSEPEANNEVVSAASPQAESTVLEEEDTSLPINTEQDDSAEADRNHLAPAGKSKRRVTIQKTTAVIHRQLTRRCCTLVRDVATVDVTGGRWIDVSD